MTLKLKQKLDRMAEDRILGVTKLNKTGCSYYVRLPRRWIIENCLECDGYYYLRTIEKSNKIIMSKIDKNLLTYKKTLSN